MGGLARQWWRLGGIAAILFVVVFVVGVALQDAPPLADDPVDEIRRDWVEGGQQYLVAGYVLGLAYVFFYVPFMLVLRALLGRAEGGIELWSRASLVGAFTILLWGIWSGMFWGALAFGDFAATASDETLRTLSVLDYYAVSGTPLAFAVFVGATSIVIARTRVLWRWLAYVGAVEVLLSLLAPLSILSVETDSFFDVVFLISFLGFVLWILLLGIAMVARRDEPGVPLASD
jgi:hypothetical protein